MAITATKAPNLHVEEVEYTAYFRPYDTHALLDFYVRNGVEHDKALLMIELMRGMMIWRRGRLKELLADKSDLGDVSVALPCSSLHLASIPWSSGAGRRSAYYCTERELKRRRREEETKLMVIWEKRNGWGEGATKDSGRLAETIQMEVFFRAELSRTRADLMSDIRKDAIWLNTMAGQIKRDLEALDQKIKEDVGVLRHE